jgi:vancomycin aglycone glucosyltransferase
MRVLLSTYDSRGGVEPLVALAVRLRERGAEVQVCAPPDCAERLAEVGVRLVPVGEPVRPLVHGTVRPSPADVPRLAAAVMGAQFDALAAAAEGADAIVTSGLVPAVAGARSVAELLGIASMMVHWCPIFLPSPHHRPQPLPGRPIPADVTDPGELDAVDVANYNAFIGEPLNARRAAVGLPAVDDVRAHIIGDRPWLAADPTLAPWPTPADLDVVQTGAWIFPDTRRLPEDVEAFLDAGLPPVYVTFGSMRPPDGFAGVAIEAIRAVGRRVLVGRGWADLDVVDDRDDCLVVGEVNQQELFGRVAAVVHHGGAGITTTAARAGAPQVVVPQVADQPYWAGRVTALGIGVAHEGPIPTGDSLAAALSRTLAPQTRARAEAVARQVRTDGAAVAADLLLDAVNREGPPMSA